MKPQPIENLLTSQNPSVRHTAKSLEVIHHFSTLISAQLHPVALGLFSRELGTPCDIEDIGDNMSKYSIDLEIRGEVCKVWAVGETLKS